MSEYIRDMRLQHAAVLLASTDQSIKEIWSTVGYNHASNFDHDFKHRFGMTPREHRARTIRPIALETFPVTTIPDASTRCKRAGGGVKVLIIDDDESTRTLIACSLAWAGYSVLEAKSGYAGIYEADRASPHVILLDYHLGDINGVEVLRAIRLRHGSDSPRVSLFTADWNIFDREDEVGILNAVTTSKLCDLDQIHRVVAYLSESTHA